MPKPIRKSKGNVILEKLETEVYGLCLKHNNDSILLCEQDLSDLEDCIKMMRGEVVDKRCKICKTEWTMCECEFKKELKAEYERGYKKGREDECFVKIN